MARITTLAIALLLLVTPALADDYTFKGFDTFSDTSSTTIIVQQPTQRDYGAEPYMGFPYMDPPNPKTSYNYRTSVLYPFSYRPCCDYYRGYFYGGYWWK